MGRDICSRFMELATIESSQLATGVGGKHYRQAVVASPPGVADALFRFGFRVGGGGGLPFLVCEFIDGCTLQQMIHERSIELSQPANVVTIIVAVLRGLSVVHDAGFVHRDIKPLNIMVTIDPAQATGSRFKVKVIDFGLARHSDDADAGGGSGKTFKTTAGVLMRTPGYDGPLARSGKVLPQVDLWAVGVALFQCLALKLPWEPGREKGFIHVPLELLLSLIHI